MTVANVKYQKDTDKLPFTLYQDDGTTADDLSNYNNILVHIASELFTVGMGYDSDLVVAKYAMNALTDYDNDNFKVISAADGTAQVNIQNDIIEAMAPGIYKVIFELRKTNSDFTDGYEIETLEEIYLERR